MYTRRSLKARLIFLILLCARNSTVKFTMGLRYIDVNWLLSRLRKLRFLLLLRSMFEILFLSRSKVVSCGRRVCAENSSSLVNLLTRVMASSNFASLNHSLPMVRLSYFSYYFFCSFSAVVKTDERSTWYYLLRLLILLKKMLFVFGGSPN